MWTSDDLAQEVFINKPHYYASLTETPSGHLKLQNEMLHGKRKETKKSL